MYKKKIKEIFIGSNNKGKLKEIADKKPELVKDAVENVEKTNPKAVTEGGMKDYLHGEAEKLSREEFLKKHGESLRGFYNAINGSEDDEDSIADSMAVEVEIVEDLGSYLGYGGNTPSESEIDDEEGDSVAATGYSRASSHSDFEAISSYRDHVRSPWGSGESSADGSLGEGMTASALGVQDSVQEDGRENQGMTLHLSHDTSTIKMRERRYSTSVDRDTDGYDGASERGGFADDIGTDVDAYEEHSQSGAVDDISKDEMIVVVVVVLPG